MVIKPIMEDLIEDLRVKIK